MRRCTRCGRLRNCMELKTSEPEDAYTTFLQDFLARAADTRIG